MLNPRVWKAVAVSVLATLMAFPFTASAQTPGYTPSANYTTTLLEGVSGSMVSLGPSGQLAIAQDSWGGGGKITVYDTWKPGRQVIATFEAPEAATFQFFGGICWIDNNTIAFTENGSTSAAFSGNVQTGSVSRLTADGALPFAAQIIRRPSDGALLVVQAGGPGGNGVSMIKDGAVTTLASGLGTGYAAGIGFASDGSLLIGDSNDPDFMGNSGLLYKLDQDGTVTAVYDLAGGAGSGLADFVVLADGSVMAATGGTLTLLNNQLNYAAPFGSFDPGWNYVSAVTYHGGSFAPGGDGVLVVNGTFTPVAGVFAVQPVPEPASMLLLAAGLGGVAWRSRKRSRR